MITQTTRISQHIFLSFLLGITYESTLPHTRVNALFYVSLAFAIQGACVWHMSPFGRHGLDYLPVTYNRWGRAVA